MRKVKVLITDDSIFMRKLLTDMLKAHPLIEVVSTARNGFEAIHQIKQLSPDVVTLDVEMPEMDGLEALQVIMKDTPVPIIMLSSTTTKGSINTIVAMEQGAVDFVSKPSGSISLDIHKVKEELIEKILLASMSNISTFKRNKKKVIDQSLITGTDRKVNLNSGSREKKNPLICIGTSTGGPRALQTVLTAIPSSIRAPIFVVQHMPKKFTKSLADRLNSLCAIKVTEAEHNQKVSCGTAYIAPGDSHMEVVKRGRDLFLVLNESPPLKGHRPSVDVLFKSISLLENHHKIAIVLTGMGADGSAGIQDIKTRGNAVAIVESEETSVVFGMPNAAIQTGLVDEILDIEDIASAIHQYTLS